MRKKNVFKYRIRAYRPLAVYTSLRVFCLLLKASKSGLLGQKSGGLFKFCCTGGVPNQEWKFICVDTVFRRLVLRKDYELLSVCFW